MKVFKHTCRILLAFFLSIFFSIHSCPAQVAADTIENAQKSEPGAYHRIISLSPSLTEILFALGLGEQVVGVTRYCDYPPEALKKSKVGGYIDPNYEAMLTLKPDLVVMLVEHEEPRAFMQQRGIDILVSNHRTLAGIHDSIAEIGRACGRTEGSQKLLTEINSKLTEIRMKTNGLPRQRVLLAAGRNPELDGLREVYIAGQDGFFDEMIELAGGQNAYTNKKIKYPKVSPEGILTMNPDVIVELMPVAEGNPEYMDRLRKQWDVVHQTKAVRNGQVYILTAEYAVIPGPRYVHTVMALAKILHPEIDLEK